MQTNPLAPPGDPRVLDSFKAHFGLRERRDPRTRLGELARAFARIPYENLTKIIKEAEFARPERARRTPAEVIAEHRSQGTGGTCFSLAATLLHLVRSLGFEADPILADRRYGDNTHCALRVWIDERPHLLDPGYLIVDPIPLDTGELQHIETAFNVLILKPHQGGDKIDLHTVTRGKQSYRLTFKTAPADDGEFIRAWDDSFDWEMMRYPVLTRIAGGHQLYLQGNRFQVRSHEEIRRQQIPPDELVRRIATEFGIAPEVTARALSTLKEKGERDGQA